MTESLSLGLQEGRLLGAHVDRLIGWESRAQVRLIARARAMGLYGALPMDVISFVALPLLEPTEEEVDVIAMAGDVREAMIAEPEGVTLKIPEHVIGGAPLAVLPPSDGWQLPITGVSGDLVPLVDAAVVEFRDRAPSVANVQDLAQEIWDRPGFGGLPLRVLHAARRLGFLTDDASRVSASTCTGWKRLTTVRGQVFLRTVPPGGRAVLSVVS